MTSNQDKDTCLPVSDVQEDKPGISEWVELKQIGDVITNGE